MVVITENQSTNVAPIDSQSPLPTEKQSTASLLIASTAEEDQSTVPASTEPQSNAPTDVQPTVAPTESRTVADPTSVHSAAPAPVPTVVASLPAGTLETPNIDALAVQTTAFASDVPQHLPSTPEVPRAATGMWLHPAFPSNAYQYPPAPPDLRQHPAASDVHQHPVPSHVHQHPASTSNAHEHIPAPSDVHQHPAPSFNAHQYHPAGSNVYQHSAFPSDVYQQPSAGSQALALSHGQQPPAPASQMMPSHAYQPTAPPGLQHPLATPHVYQPSAFAYGYASEAHASQESVEVDAAPPAFQHPLDASGGHHPSAFASSSAEFRLSPLPPAEQELPPITLPGLQLSSNFPEVTLPPAIETQPVQQGPPPATETVEATGDPEDADAEGETDADGDRQEEGGEGGNGEARPVKKAKKGVKDVKKAKSGSKKAKVEDDVEIVSDDDREDDFESKCSPYFLPFLSHLTDISYRRRSDIDPQLPDPLPWSAVSYQESQPQRPGVPSPKLYHLPHPFDAHLYRRPRYRHHQMPLPFADGPHFQDQRHRRKEEPRSRKEEPRHWRPPWLFD